MTTSINALEDLWPLQAELNARAGFDTLALGEALNAALESGDDEAARLACGKALKAYLDAMADECHELKSCLAWKNWYAEAKEGKQHILQDVQNARVEIIDMLFF